MNTKLFILLTLSCLFFNRAIVIAQHQVQIKGKIVAQKDGSTQAVPSKILDISKVGKISADANGNFEFQYAVDSNKGQETVQLNLAGYEILRPYQGVFPIDTLDYNIVVDVLVIPKNATSNYSTEVKKLRKRLANIEQKNQLSATRMNAINDSLLTNLQRNEAQKQQLQTTISSLETDLATTSADNKELMDKLATAKANLEAMQISLETANAQLETALEEKYLRQQTFHKTITEGLQEYLIRTKDVHELLLDVGNYFPSSNAPNYAPTFNKAIDEYNAILTKLNAEKDNYIQGVQQYWENPNVAKQVGQTYEVIFDLIHYPKLQPSFRELINYFRQNKKKKAIKVGEEAFNELTAPIINLEKMIEKTTLVLGEI